MDGREQFLRPSSAYMWLKCAGFATLCNTLKVAISEKDDGEDNEVREDGTACHWLAEQVWVGNSVGEVAPNGRTITEEMYDAVALYMHARAHRTNSVPVIEQKVPVSELYPGVCDGTPDRWEYDPDTKTLYVDDLKYGFVPVEAEGNPQLFLYATTVALCVLKIHDPNLRLVCTIVQPRAPHRDGPVRSWEIRLGETLGLTTQLRQASQRALAEDPQCVTSRACLRCAARFGCQAYITSAMESVEVCANSRPLHMSDAQLGYYLMELEWAKERVSRMIEAIETEMEFKAKKGVVFPGYAYQPRRGNRQWLVGPDTIAALETLYGKTLMKSKPITPRQAQLAGIPEVVIDMYSERRSGPPKLTRIEKDAIAKAFSKYPLNKEVMQNGKQ